MTGFLKTMKRFVTVLVCVDFISMMVLVPSYLLLEFINNDCLSSFLHQRFMHERLCASWAAIYFTMKLSALFLVTFAGYTSYLHACQVTSFDRLTAIWTHKSLTAAEVSITLEQQAMMAYQAVRTTPA